MELLREPVNARLALSPLRRRLLDRLREPASAAALATEFDLPRQQLAYHLKRLEEAGLVSLVGERKRRGFVERILAASARSYMIDPALIDGDEAAGRSQDRYASEHLIGTAADALRDVARMQSEADQSGRRLLTFTIETEVSFAAPGDFERFTEALAAAISATADQFHSPGGRRFRIAAIGHPAPAGKAAPKIN